MFENFAFTSYCVDINIWENLKEAVQDYEKIVVITGEKSFAAIKNNLLYALLEKEYIVEKYQGECSYEHADEILEKVQGKGYTLVIGAGGGKAIDTGKIVADRLKADMFVVPTIASTCAGTSALSVVYNNDKTFKEFAIFNAPPKKVFIDLQTIKNAPKKYIWAGMGDTLAKFYEVRMKHEYMISKNMDVNFPSSMGIQISALCRDMILKNGISAYYSNEINEEFKKIVLAIIVNTGMVSNLVDEFLNGAVAHSVFYGLTELPRTEREHLHGEVVSFGILVQLLLEGREEEYKDLLPFYKEMKFPIKFTDVAVMEEFLQEETTVINAILAGPDLIDFDFDMTDLKKIMLSL